MRSTEIFQLGKKWRLRDEPTSSDDNEITIEQVEGNISRKIWILGGENSIEALLNKTFYVGSERDVNPINWQNDLFRFIFLP